jgi:hypothetical protein
VQLVARGSLHSRDAGSTLVRPTNLRFFASIAVLHYFQTNLHRSGILYLNEWCLQAKGYVRRKKKKAPEAEAPRANPESSPLTDCSDMPRNNPTAE